MNIIIIFTPLEFSTTALVDGFHWSLSNRKSHQVSRIVNQLGIVTLKNVDSCIMLPVIYDKNH